MEVVFEFADGPYAGTVMKASELSPFNASILYGWYAMTGCGQVGQRFWAASLVQDQETGDVAGIGDQPHFYEVIDRREEDGVVVVGCKCLGASEPEEDD